MASAKSSDPKKMPIAEVRKAYDKAQILLEKGCRCAICRKMKRIENFYIDSDPITMDGEDYSFTRICKECAKSIALRRDKNGEDHTPTKESVQKALFYLNKPFLSSLWDASIQESENLVTGRTKDNVWTSYIKNVSMKNYVGMGYLDSDIFKEKVVYQDELTEDDIINSHAGQDTYDSFLKNKADVIRLLDYDPFEKESIADQPFLYSQLLGILDSSEDANDDMIRVSSSISIVRDFLQVSKIQDAVTKLTGDVNRIGDNSPTIKSLQDSKGKLTSQITGLAAESCISLKNNKSAKKGENTWTGKTKRIKELNLREGEVNGFDVQTCKGMEQVMNLSHASIMKQLALDESEWSDMVAEQRDMIVSLQKKVDEYQEISRILLRENIDLRDTMAEQGMKFEDNLVDLNDLYSKFAAEDGEDNEDES